MEQRTGSLEYLPLMSHGRRNTATCRETQDKEKMKVNREEFNNLKVGDKLILLDSIRNLEKGDTVEVLAIGIDFNLDLIKE